MGKYSHRPVQFGEWFLYRRPESPAYYRARYNRANGQLERFSLGTVSPEDAQQRLEVWWLQNREVDRERHSDASLADIFRRYWEHHAKNLPSASGNRDALAKWVEYWKESSVADLSRERQEAFIKHLEGLGIKRSTIQRTLNIGKAAISWAFKRGELSSMPFITSVTVKQHPPKGRPLEIEEIARLYLEAAPHLRIFILWMTEVAPQFQTVR
jgi:hypothetical protein